MWILLSAWRSAIFWPLSKATCLGLYHGPNEFATWARPPRNGIEAAATVLVKCGCPAHADRV